MEEKKKEEVELHIYETHPDACPRDKAFWIIWLIQVFILSALYALLYFFN